MIQQFAETAIGNKQMTNLPLLEIFLTQLEAGNAVLDRKTITLMWKNGSQSGRYSKKFHPTYLARLVDSGVLISEGSGYRLNCEEYPAGIAERVKSALDAPDPLKSRLDEVASLADREVYEWIRKTMMDAGALDLEVLGHTVLSVFFDSCGFRLHRFSSVNANDGGADFIGGDLIYCVTTTLTADKLKTDLSKTFARKVFVVKNPLNQGVHKKLAEAIQAGQVANVILAAEITGTYLEALAVKEQQFPALQFSAHLKERLITEYTKEYKAGSK